MGQHAPFTQEDHDYTPTPANRNHTRMHMCRPTPMKRHACARHLPYSRTPKQFCPQPLAAKPLLATESFDVQVGKCPPKGSLTRMRCQAASRKLCSTRSNVFLPSLGWAPGFLIFVIGFQDVSWDFLNAHRLHLFCCLIFGGAASSLAAHPCKRTLLPL